MQAIEEFQSVALMTAKAEEPMLKRDQMAVLMRKLDARRYMDELVTSTFGD